MFIKRLGVLFVSVSLLCVGNAFGANEPASSQVKSESLTVDLPQANKIYRYNKPVRLSRVLSDIYPTLSYRPYELGSSLIRLSKNKIVEQEKHAIVKQLLELNTESALFIVAQLSNLTLAYRESLPINYDNARLFLKQNPLLSGEFQLVLPKRSNHFLVMGDIHQGIPLEIPLENGQPLRHYMDAIAINHLDSSTSDSSTSDSSTSDSSTSDSPIPDSRYRPWVIQADQQHQQVSDLYWQGRPYFLSPGAVVFIGLTDLPEKFKHLNQDIVHLLTYRVEK